MSVTIIGVTDEQLADAATKAQDIANEVNTMFKNDSVQRLLRQGRIAFCYSPSVMDGVLGEVFKQRTIKWFARGALQQFMMMMDQDDDDVDPAPQFLAGSFGSVWLDVDLTGNAGDELRTMKVRVSPVKDSTGVWDIILDNAHFQQSW